jgi:sugar lactone lactonase YvrE
MCDVAVDAVLPVRAEHSEGPIWDADTERLWWIDITGRRVHRSVPATGADCSWPVEGQPGGVLMDTTGAVVVGMPDGLAYLDLDDATVTLALEVEGDKPENRLNDIKSDGHGRIWAGSMAYDKGEGKAALHLAANGTVTTVVRDLTISNGPAVDERAGRLYLADTGRMVVDVFDLDAERAELSDRRRLVDCSDEKTWPDGMTVDDEGMLWVALGRSSAVDRYRPDGALDGKVEIPTSNPTSVAFGGTDGGDLYITSSWFDLPQEERDAQPLAGSVFRCRPGVTGPSSPRVRPLH